MSTMSEMRVTIQPDERTPFSGRSLPTNWHKTDDASFLLPTSDDPDRLHFCEVKKLRTPAAAPLTYVTQELETLRERLQAESPAFPVYGYLHEIGRCAVVEEIDGQLISCLRYFANFALIVFRKGTRL